MGVMRTHICKDKILNAPIQKKKKNRTPTFSGWPVFRIRMSRSQSADLRKALIFPATRGRQVRRKSAGALRVRFRLKSWNSGVPCRAFFSDTPSKNSYFSNVFNKFLLKKIYITAQRIKFFKVFYYPNGFIRLS